MTSRSRRKRPITRLLVSTWASLGLATGAFAADAPMLKASLPISRTMAVNVVPATITPAVKPSTVRTVQATPDDIRMKRGSGQPIDDDAFYFKISKEPPTGDKLYAIESESSVLKKLESEFKAKDPGQPFLLPNAFDYFNVADMPTLGPSWLQNRKTGRRQDQLERKGEMGVSREMGEYPVGAGIEVAILNETVGSSDMFVTVRVELANPRNQFGVVLRAQDPTTLVDNAMIEEPIDQIASNKFYFVVMTADSIAVGRSIAGNRVILKTASVEAKNSADLAATIFGDEIRVLRDGQEVLRVNDGQIKAGTYSGVVGVSAVGQPVRFDDFLAVRYGGLFQARAWAPTVNRFAGPNVHYFPLYFEQPMLERFGHHGGNLVQPWASHAQFLTDSLLIFYSLGKAAPWECHSNEGFWKTGDVVLPMRVLLPVWDLNGVCLQTAAIALPFILIP